METVSYSGDPAPANRNMDSRSRMLLTLNSLAITMKLAFLSMSWHSALVTLVAFLLTPIGAQEFYGCGGFVKSDAVIDFSKIEIKLYTKQGALKDSTDCAPNNGYYLIPVYDKGEYVIKVVSLIINL